jgi:hypothetical protein
LLFSEGVVNNSEAAICENLIYPVLKEVWKVYRRKFILWSHETLILQLSSLAPSKKAPSPLLDSSRQGG